MGEAVELGSVEEISVSSFSIFLRTYYSKKNKVFKKIEYH